jgi:hypothetical protein
VSLPSNLDVEIYAKVLENVIEIFPIFFSTSENTPLCTVQCPEVWLTVGEFWARRESHFIDVEKIQKISSTHMFQSIERPEHRKGLVIWSAMAVQRCPRTQLVTCDIQRNHQPNDSDTVKYPKGAVPKITTSEIGF